MSGWGGGSGRSPFLQFLLVLWLLFLPKSQWCDLSHHMKRDVTKNDKGLCYAPFTLGGDCLVTCHNCYNPHWSLVVTSSLRLVANVRRTVSKHSRIEIFFVISAIKWTVTRLPRRVKTPMRCNCDGVARLKSKNNLRQRGAQLRLYINYVSTMSQQ